jgi:hypothetical protein
MLRLMDIATAWLVQRGQTGQWGTSPPSQNPARIAQAKEKAASGGTWLAVDTSLTTSPPGLSGDKVEGEELSIIDGVVGALTVPAKTININSKPLDCLLLTILLFIALEYTY